MAREEEKEQCMHIDIDSWRWKDLYYEYNEGDQYVTVRINFCKQCGKIINSEIE